MECTSPKTCEARDVWGRVGVPWKSFGLWILEGKVLHKGLKF